MDIAILDEIVGPSAIRKGRGWRHCALATCPAPPRTFDLVVRALPQTMNRLAIDWSLASQQRPDPSIAVAWIVLSQCCDV